MVVAEAAQGGDRDSVAMLEVELEAVVSGVEPDRGREGCCAGVVAGKRGKGGKGHLSGGTWGWWAGGGGNLVFGCA